MTPETRQQRRRAERTGQAKPPSRWPLLIGAAGAVAIALIWALSQPSDDRPIRDGAPAWSPDGRKIVFFAEGDGGRADLFVMDADGSSRRTLLSTPDADEGAPAFSPDGTRVAFDTDRDGNFEIYVTTLDRRTTTRLTRAPGRDLSPAWSPDGSRIAFMSDRGGGFDVFLMHADGSGVERLTTTGSAWFPQFSPDGRQIAMHVHRDVHVLDLESRALRRLTTDPENGMYPTWSNDGRRLAFMSWRQGRTALYTMDADGSRQEKLFEMPSGGAIDPRWSPDGRRLVFVAVPEGRPDEPQSPWHSRVIHVLDLETRQVRKLGT